MNRHPFAQFVHEHNGRWVVAQREGESYRAPIREQLRRKTGAVAAFGDLDYVSGLAYTYARRSDALRRARTLFGLDNL